MSLASPLDMLGLPDPGAEGGLEVLGQLQPGRSGDADPLQDRRQILGDGAALVLAHRPAGPVDQLEVPECRRARDTFWDIPVPKMTALGDSLWAPVRPASVALRRHPRKLGAGFAPLPQMA